MKTYHEAPLSMFDAVQSITDGDYALVHMFEKSPLYYNKFVTALEKGREVILDNSVFELGVAFDGDRYYDWIMKLNPTHYIIPDVLEDCDNTLKNMDNWFTKYKTPDNIKTIGVVQGKCYNDVVRCLREIKSRVDMIAISFDYSMYLEIRSHNKYGSFMEGRQNLIERLLREGEIDSTTKIHLLGCSLPQEFEFYKSGWVGDNINITSVDTSNPVVAGLESIKYTKYGLQDKPTKKLVEYMYEDVSVETATTIGYNISKFREFCV